MTRLFRQAASLLLLTGLVANANAITTGNLLVDPGFNSNPLIPANDILNAPFTTGAWGAENSTITGVDSGVTPFDGTLMLRMLADGTVTQAFQLIDVSLYAADIDANNATIQMSALYNTPVTVPESVSSNFLNYYDASHNAMGFTSSSGFVDNDPNTWQARINSSLPVPVGTRYVLAQVTFNSVDLGSEPGFVDHTEVTMTILPEPSSIMLFACWD